MAQALQQSKQQLHQAAMHAQQLEARVVALEAHLASLPPQQARLQPHQRQQQCQPLQNDLISPCQQQPQPQQTPQQQQQQPQQCCQQNQPGVQGRQGYPQSLPDMQQGPQQAAHQHPASSTPEQRCSAAAPGSCCPASCCPSAPAASAGPPLSTERVSGCLQYCSSIASIQAFVRKHKLLALLRTGVRPRDRERPHIRRRACVLVYCCMEQKSMHGTSCSSSKQIHAYTETELARVLQCCLLQSNCDAAPHPH